MKLPRAFISNRPALWGGVLLVVAGVANLQAASLLETINSEVSSIYDKSKDAVVKIHAERQLQMSSLSPVPPHRCATGFFITGDGLLLTANTVVDGAESHWIEWHGRRVPAKLVGQDPRTNLALLKVDPAECVEAGHQLPFLPHGDSDELRVGSMVIAIGFPFGLPSAPVVGFVSGIDIKRGSHMFVTSHIRAGCKLSRGQGGGPLLNVRGEVVGIAVAADSDDQCYALPIHAAQKVCDDFLRYGQAQHAWVGLGITEKQMTSTETGLDKYQVFVQQVFSNTPAAEAGFQDRDVLVKIYTNDVRQLADVLNTIFYFRSGDKVTVTVLREGKEQQVSLTVGSPPLLETASARPVPEFPFIRSAEQGPTIVPAAKTR
jgi:serine protease Do